MVSKRACQTLMSEERVELPGGCVHTSTMRFSARVSLTGYSEVKLRTNHMGPKSASGRFGRTRIDNIHVTDLPIGGIASGNKADLPVGSG